MPTRYRKIIAYDDLYKTIINKGFCTLCGACEAACPTNSIIIEEGVPSRTYDCSKSLDLCPICYDVCPHTEPLLSEARAFLLEAPVIDSNLGYLREALLAQTTDRDLLNQKGHGGAVIPSLLKYALDNKVIDSAVASESSSPFNGEPRSSVSLVPDDILSAVESQLVPSPVAKAFGQAVYEYGKNRVAFVGLPCHVLAIRKLEAWQHKFIDSLRLTIGLFCLWTFSMPTLLKYAFEEYGVESTQIQRLVLTDRLEIVTREGVSPLSLEEASAHIRNRCKTCTDFSAEFSDISIGGASSLGDWSVVIIRTQRGEELFSKAVNAGILNTMNLEEHPDSFVHVTETALHKKRLASKNINKRRRKGIHLPPAVDYPSSALPREFLALASQRIRDVMTKQVVTVPLDMSTNQLLNLMMKHHHLGYPVVDENSELCGIVTFQDTGKVLKENRDTTMVKDILADEVIVEFEDEPVFKAFERMLKHDIGRIVMVDRRNTKKVVGILTRTDLMHALQSALK